MKFVIQVRVRVLAPALATLLWAVGALADAAVDVDFDAALRGVKFDPKTTDGNAGSGHSAAGNGLLDSAEMAVIAAVLRNPSLDLSARGGASYTATRAAYDQARASAVTDVAALSRTYPTAAEMVTGYVMIGTAESFASIDHMLTMFGAPLKGDYSKARALGAVFGPDGDADGDGFTNRQEYAAFIDKGTQAYVVAALDPSVHPSAAQAASTRNGASPHAAAMTPKKNVGIVLYPGFEVLDVYGPTEMWSYVAEFNVVFIAENAGPVMSGQGVATVAQYGFANAPKLDVLMIPGGFGTRAQLENPALLDFLRQRSAQAEFTTSVCTGSALLARAGLLEAHKATSNKRFFSMAANQPAKVNWVVAARWVEDRTVFSSSGVSAGTDMALALIARMYGKERAESIASGVEYEWHRDANDDPFARFSDWPSKP